MADNASVPSNNSKEGKGKGKETAEPAKPYHACVKGYLYFACGACGGGLESLKKTGMPCNKCGGTKLEWEKCALCRVEETKDPVAEMLR